MTKLSSLDADMRRAHKLFTKEITVYQYTYDDTAGTNAYADGDWTESSSTVQASLRLPDEVDYTDDAAGDDADHDVNIYIAADEISVTGADGGDETRATEFEDSDTGRRYRAIGFHDESSLYRIECREIE